MVHEVICLTCGRPAPHEAEPCPACGRTDPGRAETAELPDDADERLLARVQDALRAKGELSRHHASGLRSQARARRAAAIEQRLAAQQRLLQERRRALDRSERRDEQLRRLEFDYMLAPVDKALEAHSA